MSDLFQAAQDRADKTRTNIPELTVSELAGGVQRTLENAFGRVRVRGEIAGLKLAASGHLYADLKDENACMAMICWRTTMARLTIRPEDGMEVICTGKVTTYPKSSRYQLIVESIELAGQGALLKLLEDRKKKLAAEGLFDPARKRAIPFLPDVIGVVTSPTGAVIRDILHRLDDRFPRRVLVWPVAVQGSGAAEQIAAAIDGFNALPPGGAVPRPDVLIVARGGGSLEDLMAFNEESVVRAAAACSIPLISAVGHETDTTLIDYAADRRAPTPSAAAEMAVPVRQSLVLQVMDDAQRLYGATTRNFLHWRQQLKTATARLGDPRRSVEMKIQTLDHLGHKIESGFEKTLGRRAAALQAAGAQLTHPQRLLAAKTQDLLHMEQKVTAGFEKFLGLQKNRTVQAAAHLPPPRRTIAEAARVVSLWDHRLQDVPPRLLQSPRQKLDLAGSLLEALSYHSGLKRGFAVIRDALGRPVTQAAALNTEALIDIEFQDGHKTAEIKN